MTDKQTQTAQIAIAQAGKLEAKVNQLEKRVGELEKEIQVLKGMMHSSGSL